jgi:hypothetical protein
MKRPAWRLLSGCLIAALAACTGSTVAAPAPSHTRPAPVAVTSAATGASPAQASPAATPSAVAVVTGYYRAIVTRNYRKAFGYLAPGATGPDGQRLTLGSFLQLAIFIGFSRFFDRRTPKTILGSGLLFTLIQALD